MLFDVLDEIAYAPAHGLHHIDEEGFRVFENFYDEPRGLIDEFENGRRINAGKVARGLNRDTQGLGEVARECRAGNLYRGFQCRLKSLEDFVQRCGQSIGQGLDTGDGRVSDSVYTLDSGVDNRVDALIDALGEIRKAIFEVGVYRVFGPIPEFVQLVHDPGPRRVDESNGRLLGLFNNCLDGSPDSGEDIIDGFSDRLDCLFYGAFNPIPPAFLFLRPLKLSLLRFGFLFPLALLLLGIPFPLIEFSARP